MFDSSHRVNPADSLPRHAQVQNILRRLVESGRLRPGDKIPAEVQIADALGVSKMTVNKALLTLAGEGLLVREVGRGTFIADRIAPSKARGTAVDRAVKATREGLNLPRVALSFVEGARDVLGSDYYGSLYRGVADYFAVGTDAPKAELSLSPLAAGNYVAEDEQSPADGRLIIAPRATHLSSIDALWEQGKAAVVIGASWPLLGAPGVDCDNVGASALAVHHLTDQGHRRIALLYAEPDTANTQDRILGYRRALAVAGIAPEPMLEVEAERVWKAGDKARAHLRNLLVGSEPITAIFAAGYYLALEALSLAHESELHVPGEISIIGFDDPIAAQLAYPALTTIRQPLHEMGFRAAERLLALMQGQPRDLTRDTLMAQIIVRRSTAPPLRGASQKEATPRQLVAR